MKQFAETFPPCRWKDVVESHMSPQLNTYLLHDHHDLLALKRMCQKLGIPLPPVTISRFDMPQHVVPSTRRPSAPCLMDVLKCTEEKMGHVVLNFVIDGVRLHGYACSTLLIALY